MVQLKSVWSDGTSAIVFSPLELVERLIALIPPPRANQVVYRGVLAGNATWRAGISCEVEPFIPLPPPPELSCDSLELLGSTDVVGSVDEGYVFQLRCPPGWVYDSETGACDDPADPVPYEAPPEVVERCEFNERGQLVLVVDWDGDAISASYDDQGRLVELHGEFGASVERPRRLRARVVYDAEGRLIAGLSATELGTAFEGSGGQFCRVFNDAGQLVGWTRTIYENDGNLVRTVERCVAAGPSDACPGPALDCLQYTDAEIAACQR